MSISFSRLMKRKKAVALALAGSFIAAGTHAQDVSARLDDSRRRAVVETAATMLRQRYIFPDIADQAARAIETALAKGSS